MIASVTAVNVDPSDGSFSVACDVSDGKDVVASFQQGFSAGTDRDTIDEAVSNYMRDVVPMLMGQPPVAVGDTITQE